MERLYVDVGVILMLAAYTCIYRWFVRPAILRADPNRVLLGLVLIHCGRAMGFVALMPGITLPGLAPEFAFPVAYCDVVTAVLALIGAFALQHRWSIAIPWIWVMNIFGAADILYSGTQLAVHEGFRYLGSDFFVFVWFVPLLVISHILIFRRLLLGARLATAAPA